MTMKRKISKLLIIVMLFTIFSPVSSFGQTAPSTQISMPDIEVAVSLGNSNMDISGIEKDLKEVLERDYSISPEKVKVTMFEKGNVSAANPDNWIIYDHYYDPTYLVNGSVPGGWNDRSGYQPYSYYKENYPADASSFFEDISENDNSLKACYYRAKHIYPKGNSISFLGYSAPAFKDFMIFPDENKWGKSISFTLSEGKIDTHTLEGAGFLFNAGINASGKINGYLAFYDYASPAANAEYEDGKIKYHPNIRLYKLNNVDASAFHNNLNQNIYSQWTNQAYPGFTLVATKASPSSSSIKNISIDASSSNFKFTENGTVVFDTNTIDNTISIADTQEYGFGPIVGYTAHGCSSLTYFEFKNISMSTEKARPFKEVLREPEWKEDTLKYVINIDDDTDEEFDDPETRSEILYRLIEDDISYIGVGSDENKEQGEKLIEDNNSKGIFIDQGDPDADTYEEIINSIAKKIADDSKGKDTASQAGKPVAVIEYDHQTKELSGASSYDPDGRAVSESWKWKTVSQEVYGWTDGKPDTDDDFGSGQNYYLVQLTVEDDEGLFSDPAVEYISTNGIARPVAGFSLDNKELKIYEGETSIKPTEESFHPAGADVDEYEWKVYNSVGNEVYSYNEKEPDIDFSISESDIYSIKLRVRTGNNWSSVFSQKVTVINDTSAPQIECGAVSNTSNRDGSFVVIDAGGSGVYGYRVRKNSSSDEGWGQWIQGSSGAIESGTWDSYEIQAKDNAGNLSGVLSLVNVTVTDNTPPGVVLAEIGNEKVYSVDLSVSIDENGNVYYVVLGKDEPAPSNTQIRNGLDASENPAKGGSAIVTANEENVITISELSEAADYDIYVIGEDAFGNLTEIPVKLQAKTKSLDKTPPEVVGVADGETYKEYVTITFSDDTSTAVATLNGKPFENGDSVDKNGEYTLIVTDELGNETIIYFIVDNDQESVDEDKESLEIIYEDGDNENLVRKDLTLAEAGENGTEITWESSDESVITNGGVFIKPEQDTTITLTATIKKGNKHTIKTFTVKAVADITAPELTLLGESSITVKQGSLYTEPGYTAVDNVDGNITSNVKVKGYADTKKAGSYTLTYTVADSTGNTAQKQRTVNVVKVTASTKATINADNEEKIPDEKVTEAINGAKDNGDKSIKIIVDEEPTTDKPVKVDISKEQIEKIKENNLSIMLETANTSIEVPLDSFDTSVLPDNSRLQLVCQQVDTANPENSTMVEAVKNVNPNMAIYENKIFDFKMKVVKEDTDGNVIDEEVINNFTTENDITLRILVGKDIDGNTKFMTFYYNEVTDKWEYIRGQYDAETGNMLLLTRHLSIYSIMNLSKADKQEQMADLLNDPDITVPEVLNIIEDPDMEFDENAVEEYNTFTDVHKENVAQEIINQRPGEGYDYSTLKNTYSNIVEDEVDKINGDTTNPVVTLLGDSKITLYVNRTFTDPGATAWDDQDGDITGRIVVVGSADTSKAGEYVLRYTVSDQKGNVGEAVRTVVVKRRSSGSSNGSEPTTETGTTGGGSGSGTSGSGSGQASTPSTAGQIEVVKGKEDVKIAVVSSQTGLEPREKGMKLIGQIYEINAVKGNGTEEVTLSISYAPEKVSDEDRIAVFAYNEANGSWKALGGVVDKANNKVVVKTSVKDATKIALMEYNKTFNDMDGHWAKEVAEILAARQIFEGDNYGNFNPEIGITRAEFATLITRIMNLPVTGGDTGFIDIKSSDWYAPYITAARDSGIVKGVSDTEYEPDRIVNREEMTAIIMRAYRKLQENGAIKVNDSMEKFTDTDDIGKWAYNDVYEARYLNLVQGRENGYFMPVSETLRGEAAALVYRFLKALGKI